MLKLAFNLILITALGLGIYVYCNSQRTFEATFKNIDGLPIGAQVTALGTPIGKVIKTKLIEDGVIVTIKITNKNISSPSPGSQLTITSLRPNQGRVLEIIPPGELDDTKAWIVQEPITTSNWLDAALNLLKGLKTVSHAVLQYATPENFKTARLAFSRASESLSQTADSLKEQEKILLELKDRVALKAEEANKLLAKLNKPIQELNKIIDDKNIPANLKNDLNDFSKDLISISENITSDKFLSDLISFKVQILDRLNKINTFLVEADQTVKNSELKQKIKNFNEHLANLNNFYAMIQPGDVVKIKEMVQKAREITTKASELTKQN